MAKMIAELIEQRFGLPSAAGHDAPAEGELAAILSHRTHRRYTDTPISEDLMQQVLAGGLSARLDRKSTRLNSSHSPISYAGFCLKKRKFVRQLLHDGADDVFTQTATGLRES